jgi:hypothetical protein
MKGGTPAIPQDLQERIVRLVKERALDQDSDPASAEALWSWMRKEGIVADQRGGKGGEVKKVTEPVSR